MIKPSLSTERVAAQAADGATVLNMWKRIAQTHAQTPAGCLNKSASEVWKSTVQMNGVNLVG